MSAKVNHLAEQLAKRIIMNWEFQLPTTFQDKVKAEELLEAVNSVKGSHHATSTTKKG